MGVRDRLRALAAGVAASAAAPACVDEPSFDLEGPRVVESSLPAPRNVEVPVWPELRIVFSEALDLETVHAGTVVLVEWEDTGSCDLTPLCDEGSCERGRCQEDPLGVGDLADLRRGEGVEGAIPLELAFESAAGATVLLVRPRRALRERSRHSLVLGEAIRDLAGSPLVSESALTSEWRRDLVTGLRASSGPEPLLQTPAPGQREVPTNLEWIETRFARPIDLAAGGTIALEREEGESLTLGDPLPCEGWAPGFCARWTLPGELAPGQRFAPAPASGGESIVDRQGRPAAPTPEAMWFETGAGADEVEPVLAGLSLVGEGRCVIADVEFGEPVRLTVEVAGISVTREGQGQLRVAVPLPSGAAGPGDPLAWTVEARDLAGNVALAQGEVEAGEGLDPTLPALVITELLANPAGPEPDQEFVELAALGAAGELVVAEGLYLADLPWGEVASRLATLGEPVGDALPAFTLEAGARAVIVGTGYRWGLGEDPEPSPGTQVLTVDASLAQSGLKNAGEPITLYRAQPPALVASYGNFIETGATAFNGRSVTIVDEAGCDVAENWRPHLLGSSSPGTTP